MRELYDFDLIVLQETWLTSRVGWEDFVVNDLCATKGLRGRPKGGMLPAIKESSGISIINTLKQGHSFLLTDLTVGEGTNLLSLLVINVYWNANELLDQQLEIDLINLGKQIDLWSTNNIYGQIIIAGDLNADCSVDSLTGEQLYLQLATSSIGNQKLRGFVWLKYTELWGLKQIPNDYHTWNARGYMSTIDYIFLTAKLSFSVLKFEVSM